MGLDAKWKGKKKKNQASIESTYIEDGLTLIIQGCEFSEDNNVFIKFAIEGAKERGRNRLAILIAIF